MKCPLSPPVECPSSPSSLSSTNPSVRSLVCQCRKSVHLPLLLPPPSPQTPSPPPSPFQGDILQRHLVRTRDNHRVLFRYVPRVGRRVEVDTVSLIIVKIRVICEMELNGRAVGSRWDSPIRGFGGCVGGGFCRWVPIIFHRSDVECQVTTMSIVTI